MTPRIIIYTLITACSFLCGCRKSKDADEQRLTWTTNAPLSIPYRIRLQRFEKGNLIRNPSFETGRTFTFDNAKTSFVIDSWQQMGQHVYWVDKQIDSLYAMEEAFSGNRSVKIIRKNAYEADDMGEGIMSDFIKVIPGNYTLSFYTRLENVLPVRARLGTRMFDAVEVNLQFFDRNKIVISPKFAFPHIHQIINSSFKSLSLANYHKITSFGWGKIIGKSAHFPFPEGDIPSEAQYVKIFIGLKGSGTMWIDSVSFNYSDFNFSVAERMRQYTDTSFIGYEAIIPTPKKYRKMESVYFQASGSNADQNPLIMIPPGADGLIIKAAELIRNALNSRLVTDIDKNGAVPEIQIVKNIVRLQTEKSKLVISLGPTSLYREFRARLPEQEINSYPQGYFIHSTADQPNIVFLGGNNSTGIYYAALSLLQMIDKKQPVFHNARIIDYPDFANRYCSLHMDQEANLQPEVLCAELIACKINGAFLSRKHDGHGETASSGVNRDFKLPTSFDPLFKVYRLPYYEQPTDSTLTYPLPVRVTESTFGPPVYVDPYLIKGYLGLAPLVIPPLFNNQLLDLSCLPDITDPPLKHCTALYSGCSYFSNNTDDADIERFMIYTDKRPVFMDNSMQIVTPFGHYGGNDPFYPGKIRLYNIFEPYGNDEIREHFSKLDTSLFFMNISPHGEIDLIRLATAADFMWNSDSYRGDLSLWKVLQSRYGAEVSRELIRYADKYGLMLELLLRMHEIKQVARNLKDAQQTLSELNHMVSAMGRNLGSSHRLMKELQDLNAALLIRLSEFTRNVH